MIGYWRSTTCSANDSTTWDGGYRDDNMFAIANSYTPPFVCPPPVDEPGCPLIPLKVTPKLATALLAAHLNRRIAPAFWTGKNYHKKEK